MSILRRIQSTDSQNTSAQNGVADSSSTPPLQARRVLPPLPFRTSQDTYQDLKARVQNKLLCLNWIPVWMFPESTRCAGRYKT